LPAAPLNVAVVGTGSFGRNHVRVYQELASSGQARLVALVDSDTSRNQALAAETGCRAFASLDDLLAARASGQLDVDAVSVCVPTRLHHAVSRQLLEAGIDVLVEKPITATLDEAGALVDLAERRGRILQVGHLERFNPAVSAVRPLLNSPMFFEAHRLSVFTPRALDVDVVLDLMIHDLDIVLNFTKSPVVDVRAVGLPILTPRVDIANVRVEFASGAVANFTASRVSTERVRKLRFFQPHQYVSIDYARQDVLLIDVPRASAKELATAAVTNPQPHPSAGLGLRKLDVKTGEPLRIEIESFLQSVITRQPPAVSAAEGLTALTLATQIREAMAQHHSRANLDRFTLP